MVKDLYPLNEDEIVNRALYLSEDRALLYDKPLTVSAYDALPDHCRTLDETFAKYHTRDHRDFWWLNSIYSAEAERYIVFTRSGRFTPPFLHCHNCVELFYVYHGECRHYVDGSPHTLREGDLCIIGPDTVHAVETNHEEDILFSIMISLEFFGVSFMNLLRKNQQIYHFFESILSHKQPASFVYYPTGDDPWLRDMIRYMDTDGSKEDPLYNDSLSTTVRQLLIHTLRHYEMEAVVTPSSAPQTSYRFVPIINYLTVHYSNATLHSTAQHFGYSDVYLGEMIKKTTGKTFTDYVSDIQLGQAGELLLNTDLSITEIAHQIGCYDSSHFTNKFRKRYGMTPSAYRKHPVSV